MHHLSVMPTFTSFLNQAFCYTVNIVDEGAIWCKLFCCHSGGFIGGRAGSAPPPLGDGLTPSLTVLLICDNGTILWRHHRHFYLFKQVKHGIQNIQNDCHQWLCGSFRPHQIRFRPGLRPGPRWGSIQHSPRPSSWFKGA